MPTGPQLLVESSLFLGLSALNDFIRSKRKVSLLKFIGRFMLKAVACGDLYLLML
jgi:hypothetical protein